MASVRFSRDKRGYEHVYLIDAGERGRSRVLYWFRTPPGVRVGRDPFDLDTQRTLEAQHPDVRFDWRQIIAAKMPPAAPVENWREKRHAERAVKRARAAEPVEAADAVESADMDELTEATAPVIHLEIKDAQPLNQVIAEPSGDSEPEIQKTEGAGGPPAGDAIASQPGERGRHRRRRRGGRRGRGARPESAAAPAAENDGGLDQTNPREESSKEE